MAVGFVVAAQLTATSAYWGPVVLSMVLIGAGLALTTAPATESIMGSLPREKAGVGSAVNDTTRELGGTLGVAVVGSVFSSVYGPQIVDALRGLALPAQAVGAAKESMAAAASVAAQAPTAAGQVIAGAAKSAFLDGLAAGSLVAAGATLVGAVLAFAFLPARARAASPAATGAEHERVVVAEVEVLEGA